MANRVKYSRTPHLPWSQSKTSDDLSWADCSVFEGREVVVTEKIDGECTSIYHDCFTHARSTDTEHHPSRTRIKQLAAQIGFELPEGYRLCGENIYAFHSIFYINLPDYFLAFGIYDKNNFCLPWSDVEEICNLININTVPIIYKGIWDEKIIRNLWNGNGTYPTYQTEVLEPQFPQDFKSCEAERLCCENCGWFFL